MGLINRVAISNVLNYFGDSPRAEWLPRIRYQVLDFRGQSTAINLTNGGGKTTIAEAILGVLSRDTSLTKKTKLKLSPESCQTWSHIQVELVRPLADISQADLLHEIENDINGEHWVFGVYGHRDSQQVYYYYYKGRLEDACIGNECSKSQKVTLTPNIDFTAKLKSLCAVKGTNTTEWHQALDGKANITTATIKKLADFQKRGGQDKSALLFNVKPKQGQLYSEAFFYQILAPSILEGIMDREGDDDEITLEDTVQKTILNTVVAKIQTKEKRDELAALKKDEEALKQLSDDAKAVIELNDNCEKHLAKVSKDIHVIKHLVENSTLLGIPSNKLPGGLEDEIIKKLIVEPGDTEIKILDSALLALIDEEIRLFNERANRNNINGTKVTQLVDISCDFKIQKSHGGRRGGRYYGLDDAKQLINSTKKFKHGLTKESAICLIEDAVSWFENHVDGNPFRQKLYGNEFDIEQAKKDKEDKEHKINLLQIKLLELAQTQQKLEANESLYKDLAASPLFNDAEVHAPLKTILKIEQEKQDANNKQLEFQTRKATLSVFKPDWEQFKIQFGNNSSPHIILKSKEQEKERLTTSRGQKLQQKKEEDKNREGSIKERNRLSLLRDKLEQQKDAQEKQKPYFETFSTKFGQTEPRAKERSISTERASLENDLKNLIPLEESLDECIAGLDYFHSNLAVDGETPEVWLAEKAKRRNQIIIELSEIEKAKQDIGNQIDTLDSNPVSASSTTQEALSLLAHADISFEPLYKTITGFELPKERTTQLLALYSSVLFSPVVKTESEAVSVANLFAEKRIQIPVFLFESLKRFSQSGTINIDKTGELYIASLSGVMTMPVKCILDPELIPREQERLKLELRKKIQIEEKLWKEQSLISEESDNVEQAKLARKALDIDAKSKLASLRKEKLEKQARLKTLVVYLSEEWQEVFDNAADFWKAGGQKHYLKLCESLSKTNNDWGVENAKAEYLEEKLQELDDEIACLGTEIDEILPLEIAQMLHQADKFVADDGIAFFENEANEEAVLLKAISDADSRTQYIPHLKATDEYLKNNDLSTEDVSREIGRLNKNIEGLTNEIKSLSGSIKELESTLPQLRKVLRAIDDVALNALKKYKKLAAVDLSKVVTKRWEMDDEQLIYLSKQLIAEVDADSVESYHLVTNLTNKISEELESERFDIERKAAELKRKQTDLVNRTLKLIESAEQCAEGCKSLASVEKRILEEFSSLKDAERLINLHNSISTQVSELEDQTEKLETSERKSRENVSSRLANMVGVTAKDFDILKKVCGSKNSDHESYFNLQATIISTDEMTDLIKKIEEEVELLERNRISKRQKKIEDKSQTEYEIELKEIIRERLYKNIFTSPKIWYVNKSIRASGEPNEFNNSLSEGQKAALSLMWTIRLAEFAIEREIKKQSSRLRQRTARALSENIILIDGLFSNLSNKELIESSMAGIEGTKGKFQLIGLIHNPYYENDFDKFPVFIMGKTESNGKLDGLRQEWTSFEDKTREHTFLNTAHLTYIKKNKGDGKDDSR